MSDASQYAAAGVDLARADRAKARIAEAVARSRSPLSVGAVGAFGGMVRVPPGYRSPVLVMSTDGVGTKVILAREAGRYDTVGEDLVNHSINDILVHGARGIAFMDYIAGAGLSVDVLAGLVEGVARGCQAHGVALAGGETAQMPGLYADGDFDLAGTIIGVVEEEDALHGDAIRPGDVLVGYAASGLHTNGYTLARRIVRESLGLGVHDALPGLGMSVADALLAVHRSYERALRPVLGAVHGLAHITGGGIPGNLIRVLPEGCAAVVEPGSWQWPPLFRLLAEAGHVPEAEMREVFNLGVGMIGIVPPAQVDAVRAAAGAAGTDTFVMGTIVAGERGISFPR